MRRSGFPAVLVTVLAAGCAECGGEGGDDAGVDGGLAVSELCRTLAAQQCDYFIRCHADPVSPLSGFAITDAGFLNVVPESERERCVAALTEAPTCQAITASLESGRAQFTESLFRGCLDTAYPTGTCDRDAILALQRCRDLNFLQGQVVPGGACAFDEDCAGPAFCTATSLESCGVCQTASSVTGAACTRDAECNPLTHYCTGGDGESGACEPFKAQGAACTVADLQQEECGPGRVCTLVGVGARCEPARLEGEACDLNRFQCKRSGRFVFELVCAPVVPPGGGAAVNRCVKTQTVRGAACGNGEGASFGIAAPLCPESQYCLDNLCVDRKTAGAACSDEDECGFGLRCVPPAGGGQPTCEAWAGKDAACTEDTDCQALLACDGVCESRLRGESEPCSETRPCANGACVDGTCRTKRPDGDSCANDADCESNVCEVTCQSACWD